jgi:DNA-directed RNA polymerase specialized sigma24 family protein
MAERTDYRIFEKHSDWCVALVKRTIKRRKWAARYYDELVAAGLRGLWAATLKWDRRRKFRTYAHHIIVGHCADWLRYQDFRKRDKDGNSVAIINENDLYECFRHNLSDGDSAVFSDLFDTTQAAVLNPRSYTTEEIIAEVNSWTCSKEIKRYLIDMLVVDRNQYVFGLFVRYNGRVRSLYSLLTKGIVNKYSPMTFVRRDYRARHTCLRQ